MQFFEAEKCFIHGDKIFTSESLKAAFKNTNNSDFSKAKKCDRNKCKIWTKLKVLLGTYCMGVLPK